LKIQPFEIKNSKHTKQQTSQETKLAKTVSVLSKNAEVN